MSVSHEVLEALADKVDVTDAEIVVDLVDGRRVLVPLAWFPMLLQATPAQRRNWRLIGDGEGIHWPDLDADISVGGLLVGLRQTYVT